MRKHLLLAFAAIFFFTFSRVNGQGGVATLNTTPATGNISACVGTPALSPNIQQFTVSGQNMTGNVTVTAPANFLVSLNSATGYSASLTLDPVSGTLNSTIIYVTSTSSSYGAIAGNVVLSTAGAANQSVPVSGIVRQSATVNAVPDQTVTNGGTTTVVNFTGMGNTFSWVNDNTGIGLASSGTGNIPSFTAVNNSSNIVTANVSVIPSYAGFAYIANAFSNNVSVINSLTNTVVATIDVGIEPIAVAVTPDGKFAYVVNYTTDDVSVINTTTNTVIATVPVQGSPMSVVISPDGTLAYVGNETSDNVSVINTATNAVVSTIQGVLLLSAVALSPDGNVLYIIGSTFGSFQAINTVTGAVIKTVDVGTNPQDIAVSPDGSKIYVINKGSNNVTVIDGSTYAIIATISVGSEPTAAVTSADGSVLYVTNFGGTTVSVINTNTNTVTSAITVGQTPDGISLSPDGTQLFVANYINNNVSIINTATNVETARVAVGTGPISLGKFSLSGAECQGTLVSFKIIVHPSAGGIKASNATGDIFGCVGSPSVNTSQFEVSGNNLSAGISATAPAGFELSLNSSTGFGNALTLPVINGAVNNSVIFVRSAAAAATGAISGNVVLSSAGAQDQTVAVSGVVNPLPTVNAVTGQTVMTGAAATAINFMGSNNTVFNWVNDTPGIGLPATGSGNIGSFTAMNNGTAPVIATISVTPVSAGYAYIANSGSGTVSVINTATNSIVSTITPANDPFCVCISPDGSKAYIGCSDGSSTIAVVNTTTNTIINTIPVSSSGESTGIAISADGNTLYVANYVDNTVSVVSAVTNAVLAVIPVTANPYGVALSPDGTKLYVAFVYSNYISVINTATNTVAANINVGQAPQGVAISPDGNRVYVPVLETSTVAVVNTATNSVIAQIATASPPAVVTVSPDGATAYAATEAGTVLVINTATNAIINTVTVGSSPNGICTSPDGRFIYVTNAASNNISVINASTNMVVATVKVSTDPISLGNFVTGGAGCTGTPVSFTITVLPVQAPPMFTVSNASGTISACAGTASASPAVQQFAVSGNYLTGNITVTAPAGFEVSLTTTGGYSNSVILGPANGSLNNVVVNVRSAAGDAAGSISGNVTVSATGLADQQVAVAGTVNALPVVDKVPNQNFVSGTVTTTFNFSGTAGSYAWINDDPSIGLAASGSGGIPSFAAINNTGQAITANITVTPQNTGSGCNGLPITFTVTVTPAIPATITTNGNLLPLITVYGTPSGPDSFTVSATGLGSAILITPPAGFEVSANNINFSNTASVGSSGTLAATGIYIRLAKTTPAGNYNGNITLQQGATLVDVIMPAGTVAPAPLTITVDYKTKPYGAVNPPLTATYSGFVNNDGVAQLLSPPQLSTTATTSSPVGRYSIMASNAGAANYLISYIPGVLTIAPSLSLLSIPNTFTPNGDGINDTWDIKYLEYYPGAVVSVFNRWGEKLFSSVGYAVPWDGSYNGAAAPAGTYYYVIDPKNGRSALSGWVAIIR